MKKNSLPFKQLLKIFMLCGLMSNLGDLNAQTLAFPEATGFGRYTTGARGAANPQIYLVTNLNDSGPGSFRDAVSQEGRFVIFRVGGIINTATQIVIPKNTTIAGQTATGEGIVFLGQRVTFSGASNTIARYMRIRYGGTAQNQDTSGLSNGANMIFDHMSFTWGTDEVFSINWDNKGTSPDNITIQNSIIGQALHRHNHSAGGLIQPPDGGKVSLIGNLYICNKTRNNKIKGINEFVNNVVYNWGNYGNTYGHSESGEAYIMGGDSAGRSDVNIINNYFIGGPNTGTSVSTPFNRGNENFYLYGPGNYFDNNRNGILDGNLVPQDLTGFPVGTDATNILSTPYDYPMKNTTLSAVDAYNKIVESAGASYPRRDQVENLMISDLSSKGTAGTYVYVQTNLRDQFGFTNGGAGHVYGAPAPLDTDNDGMPDAWEDANGLNKNVFDGLNVSATQAPYLNIEVYINGLTNTIPPDFIIPPSNLNFTNVASTEVPPSSSLTLNWTDGATNETNYVVERSTNGTNYTVVATLGADVTTYNDTNLTPNTMYYYQVKAINTTEASVYAGTSITTPPIPSAPAKTATPTPANASNTVELVGGNTTLKWTGSSNTTTYSVYLGTDPSNLTKLGDVAYAAAPSYLATGLSPATTYYWRVDATNVKGTATGDVWSFSALTPSLVGHWPFKEAPLEGEKIADLTTYANDGLLDVAYDNANVRVAGKHNNALDLTTSSSAMYLASIPNQDHILFDRNSFTVSYWMKAAPSLLPTNTATSLYVLCKGSITKNATTGATGKRFDVEVKGGLLRFAIDDDVTKREVTTSAAKFFTGNWVNVIIMRDMVARKIRIYTDGVFSAELDETAVTGIGEASDFVIGNIGELEFKAATNTPAPYKGSFDDLKMFNYALTAAQVTALYNQDVLSNEKFSQNKLGGIVYPNPVKDQIFITVPNYNQTEATVTLSDMTGKIILSEKVISDSNGLFSVNIAGKNIKGIYILNVSGDKLNSNFKIIAE
ncbi:LamG-like jellyroll fold domain-containing protein [Flavobacterium eburneipallidum]|uniref:LamG-like jellyroll fold domain-containing protein n=1 Tax=Flavobacterium eburneipallidum TaxID=3003263 RepID=UPI0024826347|nr:LamG-like jellyroll fold domain-containing protein [Flavobacterium eburneipallidum]